MKSQEEKDLIKRKQSFSLLSRSDEEKAISEVKRKHTRENRTKT